MIAIRFNWKLTVIVLVILALLFTRQPKRRAAQRPLRSEVIDFDVRRERMTDNLKQKATGS
jgi:hypothetical protein